MDPVVLAHPYLQQYSSIVIPGFACTRSVLVCAHWLLTQRYLSTPIPHAMTLGAMLRLIDTIMPDFPVYTFMHNPLAPINSVLVHTAGTPRYDGYCIAFTPVVPGFVPTAHFMFLQKHTPLYAPIPNVVNIVYFGDLFIDSPQLYWHANSPSPSYHVKRAQGLACLCKHRSCLHEPNDFQDAIVMSFDLKDERAGVWAQVTHFSPPYSRGPNNTICYNASDGSVCRQSGAIDLDVADTVPVQECSLGSLSLRLYETSVFERPHIVRRFKIAGYASALLGSVTTVLCLICKAVMRPMCLYTRSLPRIELLASPFGGISSSTRLCLKSFCPSDGGLFFTSLAFSGLLFLFSYFETWRPRRRTILGVVRNRTWLPPTLASMPFANSLRNRIAAGGLDASYLRNSLRRCIHETRNEYLLNSDEVDNWIQAVSTQEGTVNVALRAVTIPAPPTGTCGSCLVKASLRKKLCLRCRKFPRRVIELYFATQRVGMLPLWPQHPSIPSGVAFRSDVHASYKGVPLLTTDDAIMVYKSSLPKMTQLGLLAGPMFLGFQARCYPRGIETTIVAFAARLGIPTNNTPLPVFWPHLYEVVVSLYDLSAPYMVWTEQQVLHHQKDKDKRDKLARCYDDFNHGDKVSMQVMRRFGAFPKLEKHVSTTYMDPYDVTSMVDKSKKAPRLINSPHPHVNATMAPYTIPLLKWLKETLHEKYHIFYAGCSNPTELNDWLNHAIQFGLHALEDDVSQMDASHTHESQGFMNKIIELILTAPDYQHLLGMLKLCQRLSISQSGFRARVEEAVNASGVPLTSFLNSLTTAFVRMNAVVYAYTGCDIRDPAQHQMLKYHWAVLTNLISMAVAGDDGGLFLPPSYWGVETFSPVWMKRYVEAWTWSGFDVGPSKIKVHYPSHWRLFTFLAMRPVWSGCRYEFGVEISRRMKTMFWMLDKKLHPIAWARGVAVSLLAASRHVPVITDICEWYLKNTHGSTTHISYPIDVSFTNVDSTFYEYTVEGTLTDRTLEEFCYDYHITLDEYRDFQRMLDFIKDVHVNLEHIVLRKILAME